MKYYITILLFCAELMAIEASGLPDIKDINDIIVKNIEIVKIVPEMREENRHYYQGENNSVFFTYKNVTKEEMIKIAKEKYAPRVIKETGDMLLLKVKEKMVILDIYPLPSQARRIDPEIVLLFKNGDSYPQDISKLLFKE